MRYSVKWKGKSKFINIYAPNVLLRKGEDEND